MLKRFLASAVLVSSVAHDIAAQTRAAYQVQGDSVEAFLRAEMQRRGIPGLQVAVVRHGRIVLLGAYGMANVETGERVTNHTLFALHSATKPFTGVAMMQLAEGGQIDLAAPISHYLDGLPAAWRTVTVRQLLTHTSGIPDIIVPRTGSLIVDGDDAAWARVQTLPMEFAPGERYSYNQTNYLLLGRIIDRVTGQPFRLFIAKQQFHVAGMSLTEKAGFVDTRDTVPDRAISYRYLPNTVGGSRRADTLARAYFNIPPFLRTGAGATTTAEELARWLIALEHGRLLVRRTSLVTLWTPGLLNDGTLGATAIGWSSVNRADHRAIGRVGGDRVAFQVCPDDDLAVVLLTNLQGSSPESFMDDVAAYYVPAMRASTGFGLPPRIRALRDELMARGFDRVREVVDARKAENPKYQLDEADLNAWGYRLLSAGQQSEAIEIFRLHVSLHPESWNTYDSLAEAYEASGDRALAITNYQRSLALNPKNVHGTQHLKALAAGAARQ